MGSRLAIFLVAVLSGFVDVRSAAAQQGEPLVGEWTITGGEADGRVIVFRADGSGSLAGTEIRWQLAGAGVVRCSAGGESIDFGFRVEGNQLLLSADGETVTCRRGGGPPQQPEQPQQPQQPQQPEQPQVPPAPVPAPANPLGAPVAPTGPDFAREFKGDGIALTLAGTAGAGYTGELTYGGSVFPVSARSEGNQLTGEFTSGANRFPFEGTLTGDRLEFTSGGKTFVLTGKPSSSPANPLAGVNPLSPANPLAPGGGGAPAPAPAADSPDPLTGVHTGPAERYEHPKGYYTFDMPAGWGVLENDAETLLLNPGFKENDNLDAVVVISHGELEAAEQNLPIHELVDAAEVEILGGLRAQGINLEPAGAKARSVLLGAVPGAIQTWKGKNGAGQDLLVWFGGVTKREFYLSVLAIVVSGKEEIFLPKVKRVFSTLAPTPPERNLAAEKALAGRSFSHSDSSPSGVFTVIFEFRPGNSVRKEMLFSGGLPGGGEVGADAGDLGEYEVIGDVVYLRFKDGQRTGTVLVQNGRITGLKFGESVYKSR